MFNGLNIFKGIAMAAIVVSGTLAAQVYKVVDENGNVTYTDQAPRDGSPPMDLPEITVIETDYTDPAVAGADSDAQAAADAEEGASPRELRRMFRDFRLLSPTAEETFWGTANTVVVSWAAGSPYEDGMSVMVVVNGQSQEASPSENVPVTLDRGEHQVYAVLRDARGRRVVTTDTVTFYVKQASRLNNSG